MCSRSCSTALLRGGWLDALLAGIALGMSMLPEEFPVVLTVFMAMGAWRISRARVLTRRAAAIETLGSATVLCTDKTGTLTENRMSIAELRLADGAALRVARDAANRFRSRFASSSSYGVLASAQDPFDPMEKAFHELGARTATRHEPEHGALVRVYGLRPDLLAVTQAWRGRDGRGLVVAAKGAPEAIARAVPLARDERERMRSAFEDMAARGLRVLGVARAGSLATRLPETPARLRVRVLGARRPRRSAARRRARRDRRVPRRGHSRRDDHGRLSRDRRGDRARGRPRHVATS